MEQKFIPLSVPNLRGNELKYITDAVEQEWVSTGGAYIQKFEENIADYLKVKQAVACQSGTAAIHLALIESDIQADDEVIVPTLTFIAAVNPVKYINANPVFMDCDDSLTIDAEKVEKFCKNECIFTEGSLINKSTHRKVKAIIVVHIFGNMADMEKIMEIAEKYNLIVIEDATEALGTYYTEGKYKGKFAGTIGDFGCYSFNGNKIITTGGGGMIVAKDINKLNHIKYLSTQAKDDALNYVHNEIGYNYRMTNLQAALGVAQLENLEDYIKIKEQNYNIYKKKIELIPEAYILPFKNGIRSNHWFYSLVVEKKDITPNYLIKKFAENNIQTRPIWGLINEQKPYVNYQAYDIEIAKYYYKKIINLPCSSNLDKNSIDRVLKVIEQIL